MADITEMQMEVAKRGLEQASRRVLMQRYLLREMSGDSKHEALRMLSRLVGEVRDWKRKIYMLEHGTNPSQPRN